MNGKQFGMTRKDFLRASAAFAAAGPLAAFAKSETKPLMRLGLLADVHFETGENGKRLQNCLCYEPALRYFDERKADGVLVAGDLTDYGTGAALRQLAAIWFKVFPGNRRSDGKPIVPLFIYGDHDMGGYMHKFSWAKTHCIVPGELDEIISSGDNAARLWKECFHEEWAPIQVKECCGFQFVLAHHPLHTKESDHGNSIPGLADFMAKLGIDPKKPFFFVQHRMFRGTVGGDNPCRGWESGKTTEVLKRYPNVLAICGHGHRNAVDDLNLWQGAFTALAVPSINYCCTRQHHENGCNNSDKDMIMPRGEIRKSWQGLFGTLYADRFVVERRDFLNNLPLGPDWVIPLPSPDGSLRTEVRARKAVAPQFAKDAKISISERTVVNKAKKETEAVIVSFPVAHATAQTPRTYDYVVTARKDGKVLKEKMAFSKGQFWADRLDVKLVECAFAKSDLPDDWRTSVRFTVAPRDSFGNRGREIG